MSTLLLLVVPLGRVPLLVLLDEEELPERGGTKGMGVGPAPLLLLAGLAGPVTRPGMGGRTAAGSCFRRGGQSGKGRGAPG